MGIIDRLRGFGARQERGAAEAESGPPPEHDSESDAALTQLQAQLSAADPGDRASAAREIGKLGAAGSAAVPALIAALTDENMDARRAVAEALGELGDSRAVESLSAALSDLTDYRVVKEPLRIPSRPVDARVEAALALGSIGGDSAIKALRTAPGGDVKGDYKGLSVNEAIDKALAQLGVAGRESAGVPAELGADTMKASQDMVKAADEHRIQGRLVEALECARQATELDPTNGYAWMETGLIEVDRRDVMLATAAFARAVSADPRLKGSEPGARLAVVYDRLGMPQELEDVCSRLASTGLGLDPRAEREWERLVADTDADALRESLSVAPETAPAARAGSAAELGRAAQGLGRGRGSSEEP